MHCPDNRLSFLYVLPTFDVSGTPLGFHPNRPRPGCGMLVYDPAVGVPLIPYDRLALGARIVTMSADVE